MLVPQVVLVPQIELVQFVLLAWLAVLWDLGPQEYFFETVHSLRLELLLGSCCQHVTAIHWAGLLAVQQDGFVDRLLLWHLHQLHHWVHKCADFLGPVLVGEDIPRV